MDQIAQTYDTSLVIIRYHTPGPGSDIYYNYNSSENGVRLNYYGIQFVPWMYIDGNINGGSSFGSWSNLIHNETHVSSPVIINLSGDYDAATRNGTLDITVIAVDSIVNTNLKLRIAITESNIYYPADNGTNYHNQTFRDLTPSASGISITLHRGDVIHRSQSFSCPSPLVPSNCELAVFVQSDTGHRILQGAKIDVMDLRYHLDPFTLISPPANDTFLTCHPHLVWESSNDPDSGYAVSYTAYISPTITFDDPLISSAIPDTIWDCPDCLLYGTFYWKVVASNGHAPDLPSTDIFKFTVEPYEMRPFSLISPNQDTLLPCNPTLVWHSSNDPDSGYAISYIAQISSSVDFDQGIIYADTSADSTCICDPCFFDGIYYWRVIASNGHAPDLPSTEIYSFVIREAPLGCAYLPGDANGNGISNLSDIIWLVNFVKGGVAPIPDCNAGDPPPCSIPGNTGNHYYASYDVNGNCVANLSDLTYYVRKIRGEVDFIICPECPPVSLKSAPGRNRVNFR